MREAKNPLQRLAENVINYEKTSDTTGGIVGKDWRGEILLLGWMKAVRLLVDFAMRSMSQATGLL